MDRYEFTPMDGTDLPPLLSLDGEAPASQTFSPVQAAYLHTLIQSIRTDRFSLRKQTR